MAFDGSGVERGIAGERIGVIDCGTARDEELRGLGVALPCGFVERRGAGVVFGVDVRAMIQQQLDDFRIAARGCRVERRGLGDVHELGIGTVGEKQFREFAVVLHDRVMKRRGTGFAVLGVDLGVRVQEQRCKIGAPTPDGIVKGRGTDRIVGIYVGTGFDGGLGCIEIAVADGFAQVQALGEEQQESDERGHTRPTYCTSSSSGMPKRDSMRCFRSLMTVTRSRAVPWPAL